MQLLQANVHSDADLATLVAGSDAVVNLVAILHGDAGAFERAHLRVRRRMVWPPAR